MGCSLNYCAFSFIRFCEFILILRQDLNRIISEIYCAELATLWCHVIYTVIYYPIFTSLFCFAVLEIMPDHNGFFLPVDIFPLHSGKLASSAAGVSSKVKERLPLDRLLRNTVNESGYYGRYGYDGKLYGAGKFIGGALSLYGRDGKFHYDPSYEKMYYEGEFDEISDEEFEKYKKEMDALGAK